MSILAKPFCGLHESIPGYNLARLIRSQLLLRYSHVVRKRDEIAETPRILVLETSSLCNLSCQKCGLRNSTRSRGLMKTELAFELVDRAAAMGIEWVCLSMLGEPLMNPDLELIIARLRERGLHAYFATNGVLLTQERSKSLIQAGIEGIYVSIDGWDEQSYKERHSGAELGLVLENIDHFREQRGTGPGSPLIASITTLDSVSINHLSEIRNMLETHVDQCRISPLTDFGIPGHEIDPKLLPGTNSWSRTPCSYLWNVLNVGWDGQVTACCNDHNYLLAYHNVKDASLEEIWHSEPMRRFRRLHLDRKFDAMPMCGKCTRDWANSVAFQRIKIKFDRESSHKDDLPYQDL